MIALLLAASAVAVPLQGEWRAALDLAGGTLKFSVEVDGANRGKICIGSSCQEITSITVQGDTARFYIGDYDATITARIHADSLTGVYRNVGNRGPRTIPFRAAKGRWPSTPASPELIGRWDATFYQDTRTSPRVLEFHNTPRGLEGAFIANSGDYGVFWGTTIADSFEIAHFDGAFVYLIAGRLDGDTLRGTLHAGLRTQTRWTAVRSTGRPHLTPPTELTHADTVHPFRWSFPDLTGRMVSNDDPRFAGKVLVIDIFGSWCPTCHEAAPMLVGLYRRFHARGVEIVGFAYEVTGDSGIDNRQIRRFREKFHVPYLLLRAGLNDVEATAATLPQLSGFTAYPTTLFIGKDGRIRRVHAGFVGAATGALQTAQVVEFRTAVERLLAEP